MTSPPTQPLTPRQEETLSFITRYMEQSGYPPTVREIAGHMGIRGTNAVKKHLDALVKKGYLLRRKGARALNTESFTPRSVPVPVLGQIVAGTPLDAEENRLGTFSLDATWVQGGPSFLLRVRGDSMKMAAILDGDYVLVRASQTARPGEIVVAFIDGEATVKRLLQAGGKMILAPENPEFTPIVIPENGLFRIAGTVIGVFRLLDGVLT
ncbi:MAG: transcriptional repressor LexA [Leptospirales bacterium]